MTERNLNFTIETREKAKERQEYKCAGCGTKKGLTAHHVIPQWFTKDHLTDCDEVNDFIKGENNCIYLCTKCHKEVHLNEDIDEYILLVTYLIGSNYLERLNERDIAERKTQRTRGTTEAREDKVSQTKTRKSKPYRKTLSILKRNKIDREVKSDYTTRAREIEKSRARERDRARKEKYDFLKKARKFLFKGF